MQFKQISTIVLILKSQKPEISDETGFSARIRKLLISNKRTQAECLEIYEALKDFKFFKTIVNPQNFDIDSILYVCKYLRYEFHLSEVPIFVEGDPSNNKVYILLSGQLYVLVKQLDAYGQENFRNAILHGGDQSSNSPKSTRRMGKSPTYMANQRNQGFLRVGSRKSTFQQISSKPQEMKTVDTFTQLIEQQVSEDSPIINPLHVEVEKKDEDAKNIDNRQKRRIKPINNTHEGKKGQVQIRYKKVPPVIQIEDQGETLSEEEERHFAYKYGYVKDIIVEKGAFFGERALKNDKNRSATILPTTDVEVLYLTKDIYVSLQDVYEQERNRLTDFLSRSIPQFDNINADSIIETILYIFSTQTYLKGQEICHEGESGESIFIVQNGKCAVTKTITIDEVDNLKPDAIKLFPYYKGSLTTTEKIVLSEIGPETIFGEEVLVEGLHDVRHPEPANYAYTVEILTDGTTIMSADRKTFKLRFPEETYRAIKRLFLKKQKAHAKKLVDLLKMQHLQVISPSLGSIPLHTKRVKPVGLISKTDKINQKLDLTLSQAYMSPVLSTIKEKTVFYEHQDCPDKNVREIIRSLSPVLKYNYLPENKNTLILDCERSPSPENQFQNSNVLIKNFDYRMKNLNQLYRRHERKFGLEAERKYERRNLQKVDIFKLDFGKPDAVEKGKLMEKLNLYRSFHQEKKEEISQRMLSPERERSPVVYLLRRLNPIYNSSRAKEKTILNLTLEKEIDEINSKPENIFPTEPNNDPTPSLRSWTHSSPSHNENSECTPMKNKFLIEFDPILEKEEIETQAEGWKRTRIGPQRIEPKKRALPKIVSAEKFFKLGLQSIVLLISQILFFPGQICDNRYIFYLIKSHELI